MSLGFVPAKKYLPVGEVGVAKVQRVTVSKYESMTSAFSPGMYCPEGEYTKLIVDGTLMMSDTPMEQRSNSEIVRRAHGDVLIAGLGLGMILIPILSKPEVRSVTVIEKYQDVIDLVAPKVMTAGDRCPTCSHDSSGRLKVICADIFEWRPPKGTKYNVIYFDIWPTINEDNLPEMGKLHQAFKFFKNREDADAWMDSWQRDRLRADKYSDRRRRSFYF